MTLALGLYGTQLSQLVCWTGKGCEEGCVCLRGARYKRGEYVEASERCDSSCSRSLHSGSLATPSEMLKSRGGFDCQCVLLFAGALFSLLLSALHCTALLLVVRWSGCSCAPWKSGKFLRSRELNFQLEILLYSVLRKYHLITLGFW